MLALSTFILNVLIKIQKNREELAEINQAEEDFFEYLELVEEALEEDPEELEENLPQFNKILSRS